MRNLRYVQLAEEALYKAIQALKAATALSNTAYAQVPTPAPAAALSGSILTTPLAFTPRISGKVLFVWTVSGPADAANRQVAFVATIGALVAPNCDSSPGNGGTHTVLGAGSAILSGLAVGVPVTANVAWTSDAGTWHPSDGHGSISVIELPP